MAHHDHEVEYPIQAPVGCVTSAIGIFSGGMTSIKAEIKTLGLDAYNVQGFGQRIFLGMPDDPHPFTGQVEWGVSNEGEFTEQCRELCTTASQAFGQFGSEDFGARDWKALIKWFMENIAPLLIPLILKPA